MARPGNTRPLMGTRECAITFVWAWLVSSAGRGAFPLPFWTTGELTASLLASIIILSVIYTGCPGTLHFRSDRHSFPSPDAVLCRQKDEPARRGRGGVRRYELRAEEERRFFRFSLVFKDAITAASHKFPQSPGKLFKSSGKCHRWAERLYCYHGHTCRYLMADRR